MLLGKVELHKEETCIGSASESFFLLNSQGERKFTLFFFDNLLIRNLLGGGVDGMDVSG